MSIQILARKVANKQKLSKGNFRIQPSPLVCGCGSGASGTNTKTVVRRQYGYGLYTKKLTQKCNVVDKTNVNKTKTQMQYTEEKRITAILDASGCPIPVPKTDCGCDRKSHTVHQDVNIKTYAEYLEHYKIARRCDKKKHHSDLFS